MSDTGGLDVNNRVSETGDNDSGGGSSDGQLFNTIFSEQIQLASNTPDKSTDSPVESKESGNEQSSSTPDPLKEFWDNREQSVARFIPQIEKLDNSWKPFYDQIVKSEGYGLIQDYQRNFEGLHNRIEVMAPEAEREELWNNVLAFMTGDEGAEAKLSGNPDILKQAREMKDIVNSPSFHVTRELAEIVTPLIQFSIEGREIIAEDAVNDQLTGPGMELIFENNQLKRFIESMDIRKMPRILINDSSTRA